MHLEADLHNVIRWAGASGVRWAFSLSNAGARYAEFRNTAGDLNVLDWDAIAATDFRQPDVKERKQAEFLVHGNFPLRLVERIGARSPPTRSLAAATLAGACSPLRVEVRPEWYF